MTVIYLSTPNYFLVSLLSEVWSCCVPMIGYLDTVSHGSLFPIPVTEVGI